MTDISTHSSDKEFLNSLVEGGFKLPDDVDPYNFCLELLPNLGSPDPVLRDELSATILDNIVSDPGRITGKQAGRILALLLDEDHLFRDIGSKDVDTVFMRTFSSLLSSSILYRDSLAPSIGKDLVIGSLDRLLRYSTMERDFRGFIEGKGWAHSVAHLSDALYASAAHPQVPAGHLIRILGVTGTLSKLDTPLSSGECERLAHASSKAIEGLDDPDAVMGWIGAYEFPEDGKRSPYARYNSSNFLRSLYFDLKWEKSDPRFLDIIEAKARQLDPLHRE